jgi:glutathionyl-hydroquinone reductase
MRAIVLPFGKRTSMGELIEGTEYRSGVEAVPSEGTLKRSPSIFRNWIVSSGNDPAGASLFVAVRDRHHLYVSLACLISGLNFT